MRRFIKTVIAVLTLCLALTCFAACGKKSSHGGSGGSGSALAAVDSASIKLEVATDGVLLSWGAVADAETYVVECNGVKYETDDLIINFERVPGFTLPTDFTFNVKIYAKAGGHKNSQTVTFTQTAEAIDLTSPSIKTFENNVLSWSSVAGAVKYKVAINGTVVADSLTTTSYTVGMEPAGDIKVEISSISDNAAYRRESAKTTIGINADRTKLKLLPITEFKVQNGVLSWTKNGGAKTYKVVDINQTVAATVTGSSYDINDKLMVYGVYPVASSELIEDGDRSAHSDIKYLDGEGTAASPYLIKTAFDLRAVDYYEALYAEKLKADPNAAPNVYRIENDINYNSVAALEENSNIYTLTRPFYGTLDGNGKKLSNLRVRYDGGYWALFDHIVNGAVVRNITFDTVDIYNEIVIKKDGALPNGTSIATVAHHNYGTITGIILKNVRYTAKGGDVCGIATYNHKGATISGCVIAGGEGDNEFKQEDTEVYSQACFEMAGICIRNEGVVSSNSVYALTIRGSQSSYKDGDTVGHYNNVRTAAGIVSYNTASGSVVGNSYGAIDMICMLDDYKGQAFGGIVAQGTGLMSANTPGTLTWSATSTTGTEVSRDNGVSSDRRGKIFGYSM